jgi:hypothetical protein
MSLTLRPLTALTEISPLTLIEIPHPCGSAEKGGPSSMLLVSDACSAAEGGPLSDAHMGGRCGSTCPT